jgi:hypothetical protein
MPDITLPNTMTESASPFLPFIGKIDPDDDRYRLLSGAKMDTPPHVLERSRKIAYFQFLTNPLARRILELKTAFVIGSGISLESDNPTVKKVITEFWKDPYNDWEARLYERTLQLSLYGEWVMPVGVGRRGRTIVGFINPLNVAEVIPDPRNVEIIRQIKLEAKDSGADSDVLSVVNFNNNPRARRFGKLEGEVFFFAINKGTDALRGNSDLLPLIEYLSMFDTFLFNVNEWVAHMQSWLWDVTYEGADLNEINDFLKEFTSDVIRPGSVRAHNERVKWNVVKPEFQSIELAELVKVFRNNILIGAGIPEYFVGEVGQGGRAAIAEIGEPVYRSLKVRQNVIKNIVTKILTFVVDQAVIAGRLNDNDDLSFRVLMPNISVRDVQRTSGALWKVTQSLNVAKENQWLNEEQCKRIIMAIVDQLGVGEEVRTAHEEER